MKTHHPWIKQVLFSENCIQSRVRELGAQISEDYKGLTPVMIGVLKGSILFYSDLIRQVTIPCTFDFIRASSYGDGFESSGNVQIFSDISSAVKGKDVILIEDIIDSGHTINKLKQLMYDNGARTVAVCALLNKEERRNEHVVIEYFGFSCPNEFVVGYGLDFEQELRNLSYIAAVNPSAIEADKASQDYPAIYQACCKLS